VSGINNGANMGDDTLYSGTVGAAMEGYLFGIPAFAFSQTEKGWGHLDVAAEFAKNMVAQFQQADLIGKSPWLLNVNIPNKTSELKAATLCRLGRRHAAEPVIEQLSPRGETMYWIGNAGEAMDDGVGTDFHAAKNGHVTITPLKVDLTDHENAGFWSQNLSKLKVWEG
jgi:5'-nucleotidase